MALTAEQKKDILGQYGLHDLVTVLRAVEQGDENRGADVGVPHHRLHAGAELLAQALHGLPEVEAGVRGAAHAESFVCGKRPTVAVLTTVNATTLRLGSVPVERALCARVLRRVSRGTSTPRR